MQNRICIWFCDLFSPKVDARNLWFLLEQLVNQTVVKYTQFHMQVHESAHI